MRTRTILLSLLMIILIPSTTQGQVGNLLRNKVGKVINAGVKALDNELDKEIDTAAQKEAENIRQKAYENAEQDSPGEAEQAEEAGNETRPPQGVNLGGLFGGKVTLKYDQSYSFTSRIYMQMEIYDKKDVVKMDYYIYFSDKNPNGGFESKMVGKTDEGEEMALASSMVFDGVNKVFLILTDLGATKMGIISEVPDESTMQNQQEPQGPKPTVTRTGNSRVIAGYRCDEYLYREPESKEYAKLWVTKDLKLTGDNRIYSKAGLPAYYGIPELEGSAVLAMESYDEKNELTLKSETIEINMNFSHAISTAGFSLRQMNFNQASGQQKK